MKTVSKDVSVGRGPKAQSSASAFTFIEVLMGMMLTGISFMSLYAGLSSGVHVIQAARESLRATQILVEKTETIRLCTWEQINSGTNVPVTFVESYYPLSAQNKGITYHGTVTITNASLSANYLGDLRQVIIRVDWTNGNAPRSREMSTYVAHHGMQNYLF